MARSRFAVALIGLAIGLGPLAAQVADKRTSRTVSTSGQFIIYSQDATWRSAVSRRADDARTAWFRWLGTNGDWELPIIIRDGRTGPRPAGNPRAITALYESDGGEMKVQTDIYDATVLVTEAFETEIFKALGLEATYGKTGLKAGRQFHLIPPWMVEGMAEEFRLARTGAPDGVYAALLRSDRPPRLEEFLKAKPELMDATSLTLYRTQALALLNALMQLPEKGAGLRAFMEALQSEDASLKLLLASYPSLGGDAGKLAKLWTLSIARGSASKKLEPLSVTETERRLGEILNLSAPPDPKKPEVALPTGAGALPAIARGPGGPFILRQKAAELFTLEFRAHPIMRPVVAEYRAIAGELAEKPKRNLDKRIEENGKIRELLKQRTGGVGDYLNWFEATQVDTPSGDFISITEAQETPARNDPITQHLDAIERRGW